MIPKCAGCGNGIFTGDLKRRIGCNLIGIDSNKYALEQASKFDFDKLIQVDDFTKDKLPVDNENVDFVICKDVLEHLIDPEFLTHEVFRILKPGGYFLVHVPNHFPIWGRLKFLFTNNIDTFSYFPSSNRYDFPHIRFFTLASLENMLKISGFVSTSNISYFFTKPPIIHRLMPMFLLKWLTKVSTDNFSEGLTILAKKV